MNHVEILEKNQFGITILAPGKYLHRFKYYVGNKANWRIFKFFTPNFPKSEHVLPPDTLTCFLLLSYPVSAFLYSCCMRLRFNLELNSDLP